MTCHPIVVPAGSLLRLVSFKWAQSRRLPVPFDQVLRPLGARVTDAVTSNRALVPILDLAQNRFQIVGDRFFTFAGVLEVSGLWVV